MELGERQSHGKEDIEESRENYSYGANSIRDGISLSNQRLTRPIVSYPEILELQDLNCFLGLVIFCMTSVQFRKKLSKS